MGTWLTPAAITVAILLVTQAVLFFRWLYRTMRDAEVHRVFLRDMATNHLPHIYDGLKHIAKAQDIELSDPPPIQFIQFNGKYK